jgi:hypothetical protein
MSKTESQYIRDESGIKYALDKDEDDYVISWKLTHQNVVAGLIKVTKKTKQTLVIEDLKIFDYLETPGPRASIIEHLMRSSDPNGVNFRQRGLSKRLLSLLIGHAKEHGFRRIYGSIIILDYNENLERGLDLIRLYKKQGFKEVRSYPGCLKRAKTYICLNLKTVKAQEKKLA